MFRLRAQAHVCLGIFSFLRTQIPHCHFPPSNLGAFGHAGGSSLTGSCYSLACPCTSVIKPSCVHLYNLIWSSEFVMCDFLKFVYGYFGFDIFSRLYMNFKWTSFPPDSIYLLCVSPAYVYVFFVHVCGHTQMCVCVCEFSSVSPPSTDETQHLPIWQV